MPSMTAQHRCVDIEGQAVLSRAKRWSRLYRTAHPMEQGEMEEPRIVLAKLGFRWSPLLKVLGRAETARRRAHPNGEHLEGAA
jgi:hypothetical protein